MAIPATKDNPQFTIRKKFEEYYQLFFHQSQAGVWLSQLDKPLAINLPIEQQEEHMLKHAYLAECNLTFVKMYGYDDPENLIGARFPQLLDNAEASNLINLRTFLKDGYQTRNIETAEIGKNGERKYFLNDAVGVIEDNYLVRIWGMQRDITAEKGSKEENKKILQQLTPQELTILKLTVEGKSLKEIGAAICVNHKTVDSLRAKIRTKLGVSSLAQLMFMAHKLGFPDIGL